MRRSTQGLVLGFLAALAPFGPALAGEAAATLRNRDGAEIGVVRFSETPSGVLHIVAAAHGLPPGAHGLHVHAKGDCTAADFTSAGGHLAGSHDHGVGGKAGPHPGDLPNAHVGTDGMLEVEHFSERLHLATSGEGALFDADGSAVVIHADADDYASQPSGAAGARIACGVVELVTP